MQALVAIIHAFTKFVGHGEWGGGDSRGRNEEWRRSDDSSGGKRGDGERRGRSGYGPDANGVRVKDDVV